MSQIGYGFVGTNEFKISSANQEIVPKDENGIGYKLYKFSFKSSQDCTVKINDSQPILLEADEWFSSEGYDDIIKSFIIIEPNVPYRWIGGRK